MPLAVCALFLAAPTATPPRVLSISSAGNSLYALQGVGFEWSQWTRCHCIYDNDLIIQLPGALHLAHDGGEYH
jgi:hypothetical protein